MQTVSILFRIRVEFGYTSLNELKLIRGPLGLQIACDIFFEPKTLREIFDKYLQERI